MAEGERDVPAGDAKAAVAAQVEPRTGPDPRDGTLVDGDEAEAGPRAGGRTYRVRYEGEVRETWVLEAPPEALVRLCSRWGRHLDPGGELMVEFQETGGVVVAKAAFEVALEEDVRAGSAVEATRAFATRHGLRSFDPEKLSVVDLDAPGAAGREGSDIGIALLRVMVEAGEPMSPEEIARELHVGREPVREIISRLCTEGLLAYDGDGRFRLPPKSVAAWPATLHVKRSFLHLLSDEDARERGFDDLEEGEAVAAYDIGGPFPMYGRVRLAPDGTPA